MTAQRKRHILKLKLFLDHLLIPQYALVPFPLLHFCLIFLIETISGLPPYLLLHLPHDFRLLPGHQFLPGVVVPMKEKVIIER